MKKFFICASNFCEERLLDCQKVFDYFVANGWNPVKRVADADIVIVGTVFYLEHEDCISISTIRYYVKRKLPEAKMYIIGCASNSLVELSAQFSNLIPIASADLSQFDDVINPRIKFNEVADPTRIDNSQVIFIPLLKRLLLFKTRLEKISKDIKLDHHLLNFALYSLRNMFRYILLSKSYIHPSMLNYGNNYVYLRVSRGCTNNCSYCAIKNFAGSFKSKSVEKIITDFRRNLLSGFRFFYLSSEDTGCYGLDIGTTSVNLLKEIFLAGEGYDFKLMVTNFNAQWFVKYYDQLKDVLLKNQRKILFFQVPVQSGSNRILNLMHRPYRIEDVQRNIIDLKSSAKYLTLTTDIIVGFPGESREDFEATKTFLRKVKLSFVAIFSYEDRDFVESSSLNRKVSFREKEERKFELLKIQNYFIKNRVLLKKLSEFIKEIS